MNIEHPKVSDLHKTRQTTLAAERQKLLALSPEAALDAIADHPYPVTLVQSLTEEDLYLLMHTIGPDDALPVLALASNAQWEYVLDMEVWSRDRMDQRAMTQWFSRLLKADPDRFTHWITKDKLDELEYYFFRNIEVVIREYEQDPAELDEAFFSEDQTHYARLRKLPTPGAQDKQFEEERNLLLNDLMKRLAVFDYTRYIGLLLGSTAVIPAEAEEELWRLRNVRLAEKGFLPYDEAIGIYQPLNVADLLKRGRKARQHSGRPVESYPLLADRLKAPQAANRFVKTLARLQDQSTLQRLQSEFAGLCNQVIAADQQQIREKGALAQVVKKAGDYISIGLEKIADAAPVEDPYADANLIQTYLLSDLFRVGFGCALALKWKAESWHRTSWSLRAGLPLGFWGEEWFGLLGGLLLKKPLFFDNYVTGKLYREFATLSDIHKTGQMLAEITAFDDLLALMGIDPGAFKAYGYLTFQNLILTLWANHHLKLPGSDLNARPLTLEEFRLLFEALWQDDVVPRRISNAVREDFLGWLAGRSALAANAISERMGTALERLFAEIESELGSVDTRDLDPRYIRLFLFQGPSAQHTAHRK